MQSGSIFEGSQLETVDIGPAINFLGNAVARPLIYISICFFFSSLNTYNISQPSLATAEFADGSLYHSPERMKFRGKLTPMDIKVFEPMRQKAGPSGCSVKNGGCSHLCLAAPGGYTCSCPTGVKLLNNRTCADGYDQLLLLAKRFETTDSTKSRRSSV